MPVIRRLSDAPNRWKVEAAPLSSIANHEKKMPANFIAKDGYGITAACRRYLAPLVRGEAPTAWGRDGLPAYARPALRLVPKRLPAFA
jgi:6-phosphofructokinase 1